MTQTSLYLMAAAFAAVIVWTARRAWQSYVKEPADLAERAEWYAREEEKRNGWTGVCWQWPETGE